MRNIIIVIILLISSFAYGRYSAPTKVEMKVVTVEKVVTQQVVHTVTKIIDKPDGTKETTITQDKDTEIRKDTSKDKQSQIIVAHTDVNVSLLVGAQPHLFQGASIGPVVYGVSTSKSLLGPISIGAWALSDYTAGLSLGLNF